VITATASTFEAKDVLANALVLESLIFVAFSFSYTLAQPTEGGRHPFFARGWFGWLVVTAIGAVAAAAGAAWWQIYHSSWPDHPVGWIEAGGLAVGIIGQPVFAAVINAQAPASSDAR
jgi:hypothetical protein